jgi:DeoR family transcriptional regulator, fructose operon transcriptional repressor
MNKEERHGFILKQLEMYEKVWVTDLARMKNVTPETIRRDLHELEGNEKLTRIHGGAVPYRPDEKEMVYEKKLSFHLEAKKRIAKKAAELIQDGDTIVVDAGTTTVHIADMIQEVHGLTVVTNSLSAAQRFNLAIEERRMTGQVIMLPGMTNPYQASVKGTYTVEFLRRFHFHRAFISCGGVTKEAVYDFDMEESLVSETMMECSREAILLTDSSKLNKKSVFEIGPITNLTKIICDSEKPVGWNEHGYEWIIVETSWGRAERYESRLPYTP